MDEAESQPAKQSPDGCEAPHSDQIACPICGELAERGFIHARGTINWGRGAMSSFKLAHTERLTPLLAIAGTMYGIRCRGCQVIIVESKG
jgi:hypothetical protein